MISFRENLENVQKDLFRYALYLTYNQEDACDLLQETSLKALDNEDKFITESNFKAWVFTIMHNLFCNNYHKKEFERTHIDHPDNFYLLHLIDSAYSTDSTYDLKEVVRVLGSLQSEHRIPFSMYVSGFKYREIAEKLDLPLGTVKSRIFTARGKLQAELRDFI
ncbi:ECF RNA polymerase sigma factor EcfG [termite gut metagenome]|uniref:ECF RNA polymerase sigma factor EcfG n=1 Tax=termite gut metagenome TaxID=433724 RepID=A0A5J4QMI7_9ZZZZ